MHSYLLHSISISESYSPVFQSLMIYGNAERSTNGILTAVTFSYAVLLVILAIIVIFEGVENLLRNLWQPILFKQRKYGNLYRGKSRVELHYDSLLTILKLLLIVCRREYSKHCSVQTYGGLYNIRNITLVGLRVEILKLLA